MAEVEEPTVAPGETTAEAPVPAGYEKVYSEITGRHYLRLLIPE